MPDIDSGAMNPPLPEDVREAAREAVEEVYPQPKELGEVNEYVDVESE